MKWRKHITKNRIIIGALIFSLVLLGVFAQQPYFMYGIQQPYSFMISKDQEGNFYAKSKFGLIEYSGTDAHAVLQGAIDNAHATDIHSVIFLSGRWIYSLGTNTLILRDGLSLISEGAKWNRFTGKSWVTISYSGTGTALKTENVSTGATIKIQSICIEQYGTSETGCALDLSSSRFSIYRDLSIEGFEYAIYMNGENFYDGGTVAKPCYNNYFYSIETSNCKNGIYIKGNNEGDNYFYGTVHFNFGSGTGNAIELDGNPTQGHGNNGLNKFFGVKITSDFLYGIKISPYTGLNEFYGIHCEQPIFVNESSRANKICGYANSDIEIDGYGNYRITHIELIGLDMGTRIHFSSGWRSWNPPEMTTVINASTPTLYWTRGYLRTPVDDYTSGNVYAFYFNCTYLVTGVTITPYTQHNYNSLEGFWGFDTNTGVQGDRYCIRIHWSVEHSVSSDYAEIYVELQ